MGRYVNDLTMARMDAKLETEAFADIVARAAGAQEHNEVPFVVVPEGHRIEVVDVERFQDQPNRKRGRLVFHDIDSFIHYVSKHKNPQTLALVDLTRASIAAVLNHHGPARNDAGWGDHQARYDPRWTPAWTAWTGFDDKWQTQSDFAEFLEERIGDIAVPDGAQLLEVVKNLRMNLNVRFDSSKVLHNGTVQLTYHEDLESGGGAKGDLKVPEYFTLLLKPFDDAEPVTIEARLRITPPRDGEVRFMFKLGERVREVKDEQIAAMVQRVEEATDLVVLNGELAS